MVLIKNDLGQNVGYINNKIYYSNRNEKHFMKKYQGFGISVSIIKQLLEAGCEDVFITYKGKKITKYKCSLKQFIDSNKTHVFMDIDLQNFVSCRDMINLSKEVEVKVEVKEEVKEELEGLDKWF